MAVAEPSFNTSMDSTSSGATVFRLPGTPSTNTNGEVPPFKDEIPRSIICVLPVGSPEGKEIFSPATLPCISWPASVTAPFTKLSDFTLEIALVTSPFRCVP